MLRFEQKIYSREKISEVFPHEYKIPAIRKNEKTVGFSKNTTTTENPS